MIIAELRRTGDIVEFTPEQWEGLNVNNDRSQYWKVIDASGLLQDVKPIEAVKVEEIKTFVDVAYEVGRDYAQMLDDAGIKYDKRIKDQDKLKELYESHTEDETNLQNNTI